MTTDHPGLCGQTIELWHRGTKDDQESVHGRILEGTFGDFNDVAITEEELELSEGAGHAGMSAVIGLTGRKPA